MKISVILPSFLGEYKNCATNREEKFLRAVDSFIMQVHLEKELIIVSDGCEITKKLYEEHYKSHHQIKFVALPKQPIFSGMVREAGLVWATGEVITYLDADDFFGSSHLAVIASSFDHADETKWCYWNDYLYYNAKDIQLREINLVYMGIGTSNIAHRNNMDISWLNYDGYGHDWFFVKNQLMQHETKKIFNTEYYVCHLAHMKHDA